MTRLSTRSVAPAERQKRPTKQSPPACSACDLRELCAISQAENYRRRALIYPFARAECEPAGDEILAPRRLATTAPGEPNTDDEPVPAGALPDVIVDLLAGADQPLTARQIAEEIGFTNRRQVNRLSRALTRLRHAGRLQIVGSIPVPDARPMNLWTLT